MQTGTGPKRPAGENTQSAGAWIGPADRRKDNEILTIQARQSSEGQPGSFIFFIRQEDTTDLAENRW